MTQLDQTQLKYLAAATALKHMLSGRHFSICDVDNVAKLLGVKAEQKPEYRILRSLHCVDYVDIPTELRQQLPALLKACLQEEPSLAELFGGNVVPIRRLSINLEDSSVQETSLVPAQPVQQEQRGFWAWLKSGRFGQ